MMNSIIVIRLIFKIKNSKFRTLKEFYRKKTFTSFITFCDSTLSLILDSKNWIYKFLILLIQYIEISFQVAPR